MKGKAPWERNMSKRKIYLQFREAWNAAAKIPGFFDEEIPEVCLFENVFFFINATILTGN